MYKLPLLLLLILQASIVNKGFAQEKRSRIDSLIEKLNNSKEADKAKVYADLAWSYKDISGDSALIFAQQSIHYSRKYNNKIIEGEGYALVGSVYKTRGDYEKAITWQLKGLAIAEELKDERALASSYNGIGITYKKMRRWDDALKYYQKANLLALKLNEPSKASLTFNNMGTIYLEKRDWPAVQRNYDSAVKYAELAKDNHAMATVLSNMADLYREQGKFDLALTTQKRCLGYDKANEDKYGMFVSYFQIGRVYSELHDYTRWRAYFDSAEAIVKAEHLNREYIDLLSWSATVSEWQGNIKQAYEYYRQARAINDSLLNETTTRQVSELQTQYETAKKEQQIAKQQAELDRKNFIIWGITGLVLLGSLLAYSSYRRYRLHQQAKLQKAVLREQELATQAVIAAEEKERKRIAGDLHDGVGQMMSAARMNLSIVASNMKFDNDEQKQSFDKALSLVDDSCKEVRTVSHNIMPNALLKTGLTSAIREFLQKIDHRALEVNLYTDGINERLPSNIETVLYRVIQECVNNVIKHSGANKLDLTLVKDEDGLSVTIEDNGHGFSMKEVQHREGIGLKNMQSRVQYLKGSIEWDSAPGKGTVVIIHIPAAMFDLSL